MNALSHVQASARETSAGAVASSTSASKQEAEARADAYDRRLMSAQQVMEQLKAGIGSLFQTAVSPQGWLSCGAWSWGSTHFLPHRVVSLLANRVGPIVGGLQTEAWRVCRAGLQH